MQDVRAWTQRGEGMEEEIPSLAPEFPYFASRVFLHLYEVPWHWHTAMELFYVERGTIVFQFSEKSASFPAGTGGLLLGGTLHSSKALDRSEETVGLVHLFDSALLSGGIGTFLDQIYILPVTTAKASPLLVLLGKSPAEREILEALKASFTLNPSSLGYAMRLRNTLSELWIKITALPRDFGVHRKVEDSRLMPIVEYIFKHLHEKLSIHELATSAYVSERVCYRLFHQAFRMSPMEYLRKCRISMAKRLLIKGEAPVTEIAFLCGFGSSSALGKVFREETGLTPRGFRKKWQNMTK